MTVARAKGLIESARSMDLRGIDFVENMPIEIVASCGNGIGPDWLSRHCRRLLDWWWSDFRPAALIHDCRYMYSFDRSEAARLSANEEFGSNCRKIADYEYRWYNPIRYFARARAKEMRSMCDMFGQTAWEKCNRDKKTE